ncbi:hypothetical protein [Sediminitomix flava]|uniref:Uncharacterized protein n=1 Tax=Sediminitomix flava TaxID=379075 RepID=A0A316A0E5_SEDFL|nr:hypothetical protein [Sediminitomix flava]PWJ43117.1 hypothetical protein BC781_102666 [Sediminitomix flava]
MSAKKYIFLLFGLFSIQSISNAQIISEEELYLPLKYKDLFPLIEANEDENPKVLRHMKKFLQYHPLEVNVRYQIGKYYERQIKGFDVLKEDDAVFATVDSTVKYMEMTLPVLNEKEVKGKKAKTFYLEFLKSSFAQVGQEKVDHFLVKKEIESRVAAAKLYKANVDTVNMYFNKAVIHYTEGQEEFISICEKYGTLKDLYMMADADLFERLAKVKANYNAFVAYFDKYKAFIKDFPIEGYNQTYTLAPIENYRLHGFAKSDFLANEITVWDYSTWHDDVVAYHTEHIVPLRALITSYDKELDLGIKERATATVPNEEDLRVNRKNILKIKKFDLSALPVDLYRYKVSKINMLNQKIQGDSATSALSYQRELRSLAEQWTYTMISEDFLGKVKAKSKDPVQLLKHRDFFDELYLGKLNSFLGAEKKQLSRESLKTQNDIIDLISESNKPFTDSLYVIYDEVKIPLFIDEDGQKDDDLLFDIGSELEEDEFATEKKEVKVEKRETRYFTQFLERSTDSTFVVAGYKSDHTGRKPFILQVKGEELDWYKEPQIAEDSLKGTLHTKVAAFNIKRRNTTLVLHTEATEENEKGETVMNTLVRFNDRGMQGHNFIVPSQLEPETVSPFAEKRAYLFTFKSEGISTPDNLQPTQLLCAKSDGEELWADSLMLAGEIQSFEPFGDHLLLVSNYQSIVDAKKQKVNAVDASSGGTNIYIGVYDHLGNIIRDYKTKSKTQYAVEAVSNHDDRINIIGMEGKKSDDKDLKDQKLVLLTLNDELRLIQGNVE